VTNICVSSANKPISASSPMFNENHLHVIKITLAQELNLPALHLFSVWEEIYLFHTECLQAPGVVPTDCFQCYS
jgi:hypothetical protein